MFLLIFIISIPLIKCALTPEEEAEAQKEAKIVVKEIKRLIKSKNPEDKKTAYQMYSVLMYDNRLCQNTGIRAACRATF